MDEDWELLLAFLPDDWEALALRSGALKGLRKDKSAESLLRVLLMHLGCGHSLRETVARARQSGLADLSDVALMKRLKKARDWLHGLCVALFLENGVALSAAGSGLQVRAFDATTVKEPGKTGSLWRIHYSVNLPSLRCDHFGITRTEGAGSGESFLRFPIRAGDFVLADRGYSTAPGIAYAAASGGRVTVRVNTGSLVLNSPGGGRFDLLEAVRSLGRPGIAASWPAVAGEREQAVPGRLCALRKSEEAIRAAQDKVRKKAKRNGREIKPETLEYATCVILFTTFPEDGFPAGDVLEWYRLRWQVELVFKRFKSLARLGHLPKRDDESARAWLYGKLLTALIAEKLVSHAAAVSPWGYELARAADAQRLARLQIHVQPGDPGH